MLSKGYWRTVGCVKVWRESGRIGEYASEGVSRDSQVIQGGPTAIVRMLTPE